MPHWEDDACSDSSWLFASCDAESDSSWLLAGTVGLQPQQLDSDLRSNVSWDMLSDKDQCMTPRGFCQTLPQEAQIKECLAADISTSSLIGLIRAGNAELALRLLRDSPELAQVTEDGETALSWAVYKAKCNNVAWLELVCVLLIHAPADIKKKNWLQFLPLHDAAWGNAPAAIGTVLCAEFPDAMHMCARGQTPLQIGHYHHTTSRCEFSWPAPGYMLSFASRLAQDTDFLKVIADLRLSSCTQEMLRSMSAADLQSHFRVQQPIAELIKLFLTPPQVRAPEWAPAMPSIPEGRHFRRAGKDSATAPETSACTIENALPALASDDLFAREECAKNTRRFAGVRRARNARCSFRNLMVVSDSQGGRFFLSTHSVRAMPQRLEGERKERKWPSKVHQTQERKKNRALKEDLMQACITTF